MIASLLVGLVQIVAGTQARWTGCEPSPKQRIYFANHSSHLDFVVLWAALPAAVREVTRPVAARDYWEKTALRRWLATHVFNASLVERGAGAAGGRDSAVEAARRAVEETARALGEKHSLILFPEGTRGSGEAVAPFKAGLYYLALARPDVELVPTRLENLNRILPKGEVMPVPLMGTVTFGAPISVREGEAKADFLARARDAVVALGSAGAA